MTPSHLSDGQRQQQALRTIVSVAHSFSSLVESMIPASDSRYPISSSDFLPSKPLPVPRALAPSLLHLGLDESTAQSMSDVFSYRAEQLKKVFEAQLATTTQALTRFPLPSAATDCADKLWSAVSHRYTEALKAMESSALSVAQRHIHDRCNGTSHTAGGSEFMVHKDTPRIRSSSFNYAALPFLEHAFDLKHTPSHGDKVWLSKTTGMTFQQINAWFQNRRRRTKEKYGSLAGKPTTEKVSLEEMVSRMRSLPMAPIKAVEADDSEQSEYETVYASDSDSDSDERVETLTVKPTCKLLASFTPSHTFPTPRSYPDKAAFPPHSSRPCFPPPAWVRQPTIPNTRPTVDLHDMVAEIGALSVQEEVRVERLKKRPTHPLNKARRLIPPTPKPDRLAARSAITTIPCRAPLPSLLRGHNVRLTSSRTGTLSMPLGPREATPRPQRNPADQHLPPAASASSAPASSSAWPSDTPLSSRSFPSSLSWGSHRLEILDGSAHTIAAPRSTRTMAPLPRRLLPVEQPALAEVVTQPSSPPSLSIIPTSPRRLARLPRRARPDSSSPPERSRVSSSTSDTASYQHSSPSPSSGADSLPGTPSPTLPRAQLHHTPSFSSSWSTALNAAALEDLFADHNHQYSASSDGMQLMASAPASSTRQMAMVKASAPDPFFSPTELLFAV